MPFRFTQNNLVLDHLPKFSSVINKKKVLCTLILNPFEKEIYMSVSVGQKAPNFKTAAYYKGNFTEVQLSDFDGKWRLTLFLPR